MSSPDRLKDLDDVIQLIRKNKIPKTFENELHPWVRVKFHEMWELAKFPSEERSPQGNSTKRKRK